MKTLVFLTVACATLLLATVGATLLVASYAHAGSDSSSPRIQMLSGTFADQSLPADSMTKVTLISIPFSLSTKGKLAATSLMNAYSYYNHVADATCELDVDDIAFFSATTAAPDYSWTSVGVTSATTRIAAGSHTFALKCVASGNQGTLTVHSLGTSVIITG